MRILVTGGAGFIGSNFVQYVRRERPDWQVVIYDLLTYAGNYRNVEALIGKQVEFIKADICDEVAIGRAVKNCDIIVNFAAETHNDNSLIEPWPFIQTNLIGTYRVLEAVRRYGKRLHHISTDEVYGSLGLKEQVKFGEESPYNPSSPYSATKAGADLLIKAWIRSYSVQATISNSSNTYGPYQHVEKFIPRQITEILEGRRPRLYGNGGNIRDWLYVEDHCSALLTILEKGKLGETYLIGASNESSNKEVVQTILEIMGMNIADIEYVKDRAGHDDRYAINSSKLQDDLGWRPKYTNFNKSLGETIEWYKINHDLWLSEKAETEAKYRKIGQ
jgi:dTDP-glucose 4,6-dehydratase